MWIELEDPNPESIMDFLRICEIARSSRHGASKVKEVLKEHKRLEKVWRNVERLMRDTDTMDMCALFWNEIATPFYVEMVKEPETEFIPLRLPPRKLPRRNKSKLSPTWKFSPTLKLTMMDWIMWVLFFVFLYLVFVIIQG
ncbi:unnamed protein product [Cochlearia groenlandica]